MSELHARKRFGQHFLHDANIVNRIIREIDPQDDQHIVEIGGGLGALSTPLAPLAGRFDIVELDDRFVPRLSEEFRDRPNVHVHHADALKFNFGALAEGGKKIRVVGNLPYNISTPLLFHLLEFRSSVEDMHFMLQKEVVDRMAAPPGNKTYGRLSVMLSRWTQIESCFDIRPGSFSPPPKVMSSIARLRVRTSPRFNVINEQRFAKLVTHLFSMRRKTVGRSLRGMISADKLAALGIDPKARAETFAPEIFAQLSDAID